MPKRPKEKSPHLQGLEAVFERHTRRFSPFDILGLRTSEGERSEPERTETDHEEQPTHMGVGTPPHDETTHTHVGATHICAPPTHTRVVVFKDLNTNYKSTHTHVGTTHAHGQTTHMGVGNGDPQTTEDAVPSPAPSAQVEI